MDCYAPSACLMPPEARGAESSGAGAKIVVRSIYLHVDAAT